MDRTGGNTAATVYAAGCTGESLEKFKPSKKINREATSVWSVPLLIGGEQLL